VSHLVLLRHGQSIWNRERRFTGWSDVPITPKGTAECERAGRLLARAGYRFDICLTSVLDRGLAAAEAAIRGLDARDLKVERSWRLNERHFGALQGLRRKDVVEAFGMQQMVRWQSSYDTRPPPLEDDDERLPERDPLYAGLKKSDLPRSESLADTYHRVAPFWHEAIVPLLEQDQSVLVVAHKNSLRVMMKLVEDLEDHQVTKLELRTGQPLAYELDAALSIVHRGFLQRQRRNLRFWTWLSPE
jgi:2,3-bisphosphoglycerate-dependent phosphoglycerate mutase